MRSRGEARSVQETLLWTDPIVEEIHAIRARLAEAHGDDLHAIAEYFRAEQQRYATRVVSYPPRRPAGWTPPAAASAKSLV